MKKIALIVFCFAAFSSLFSQPPTLRTLTLDQAVKTALTRNIDIIRSQNTLEGQESALWVAYGQFMPTVSVNGGWSRTQNDAPTQFIGGVPIATGSSISNSYRTSLSTSVVLFDGFGNTSNLSKATNTSASYEYSLFRTRQNVVFTTQTKYTTVLRTKSLLKVSEDNLKRSRQQLEQIVEKNKVGAVALADVYRQQVQTSNDELTLIKAQNSFDNAKADLLYILSIDPSEEYDFDDPSLLVERPSAADSIEARSISNYSAVVRQAIDIRPDYQAAVFSKRIAENDITISKTGYYPTVSASASYSLNNDVLSELSDKKTISWGLNFSIPIFSGFQTNNQVQAAQIRLRNADEQLKQVERLVQVDVRKAILDFESARKLVDVTEQSVISAKEDLKIAEERYSLGAGTLLDLLTGNANYSKAMSDRVNSVYDYHIAKQQLKYTIGSERY